MSGETFESKHDENANAPTEQFSWQSEAEPRGHYDWQDFSIWSDEDEEDAHKSRRQYNFAVSALGCRDALYRNDGTADWLRCTLLAVDHDLPCMQSPAKQTVAYFLLGELPTQLEDLCELALEGKPWLWKRVLSYFVIGEK